MQVPQSCLTLYDPKDCCPPGPSVHGILQVRILECAAIPGVPKCEWVEMVRKGLSRKDRVCLGWLPSKQSLGGETVYK